MTDIAQSSTGPRLLGPHDGETLGATGRQDRFMIHSADTEGRFSLVEHILASRALAAPMHRHTREDEYTFVLELISPAGLEDLLRQLDVVTDWPGPAALAEMTGRYGCELDFEATGPVIERHGLESRPAGRRLGHRVHAGGSR